MHNLEKFISRNGAKHYNLNFNNEKITLIKSTKALTLKKYLDVNKKTINIFEPDFSIFWDIANRST